MWRTRVCNLCVSKEELIPWAWIWMQWGRTTPSDESVMEEAQIEKSYTSIEHTHTHTHWRSKLRTGLGLLSGLLHVLNGARISEKLKVSRSDLHILFFLGPCAYVWVFPGLVLRLFWSRVLRKIGTERTQNLVMLCFHQTLCLLKDILAVEFGVQSWYQHNKCIAECEILWRLSFLLLCLCPSSYWVGVSRLVEDVLFFASLTLSSTLWTREAENNWWSLHWKKFLEGKSPKSWFSVICTDWNEDPLCSDCIYVPSREWDPWDNEQLILAVMEAWASCSLCLCKWENVNRG